jgi:hypothetical protein
VLGSWDGLGLGLAPGEAMGLAMGLAMALGEFCDAVALDVATAPNEEVACWAWVGPQAAAITTRRRISRLMTL